MGDSALDGYIVLLGLCFETSFLSVVPISGVDEVAHPIIKIATLNDTDKIVTKTRPFSVCMGIPPLAFWGRLLTILSGILQLFKPIFY